MPTARDVALRIQFVGNVLERGAGISQIPDDRQHIGVSGPSTFPIRPRSSRPASGQRCQTDSQASPCRACVG
jgi:hypothetical protein